MICVGRILKEEVELFVAEYSLKPAWIASTDRSNSCASDSTVAFGPGAIAALGTQSGSCRITEAARSASIHRTELETHAYFLLLTFMLKHLLLNLT